MIQLKQFCTFTLWWNAAFCRGVLLSPYPSKLTTRASSGVIRNSEDKPRAYNDLSEKCLPIPCSHDDDLEGCSNSPSLTEDTNFWKLNWPNNETNLHNFKSNYIEYWACGGSKEIKRGKLRENTDQLSAKGMVKTRWRDKPWVEMEEEGTKGIDMKHCKKSIWLDLASLVPLDNPKGRGSSGTALATPSRVVGVDMSNSQNPPSIAHLNLFIVPQLKPSKVAGFGKCQAFAERNHIFELG